MINVSEEIKFRKQINRLVEQAEKALSNTGFCIIEIDDGPIGATVRNALKKGSPIGKIEDYEILKNDSDYIFYVMSEDSAIKIDV